MSPGDWALLIGLLANAAALLFGLWLGRKQTRLIVDDLHKLEVSTNSKMDQLLSTTKSAAHAEGLEEGRVAGEVKAARLAAHKAD